MTLDNYVDVMKAGDVFNVKDINPNWTENQRTALFTIKINIVTKDKIGFTWTETVSGRVTNDAASAFKSRCKEYWKRYEVIKEKSQDRKMTTNLYDRLPKSDWNW